MKFAKAVKKLKFWSRKNKKKKTTDHHPPPPPPPPPCHCCHSWLSAPVQPSAPPLPLWFEYEPTHNAFSESAIGTDSSSSQSEFTQHEIVPELNSLYSTSTVVPVSNASYQQYMVPNPVYGVPVVAAVRREKSAGLFGCFVDIGRHLIRCFCPCFHIREVV